MEMRERNYFLEETFFLGAALVLGASLERTDLILAALFLWIACFLDALSAKEIAFWIDSFEEFLLATLTAISSLEITDLLIFAF
jgi:hypothetical protein